MRIRHTRNVPLKLGPPELDEAFPIHCETLMRIDKRLPVTYHFHDDLEISYCHSGAGVFAVGEKLFSFRPGDAIVINPHEMHFARARKGTPCSWTRILVDPVRLLMPFPCDASILETEQFSGECFHNILRGPKHEDACALIHELIHELKEKAPGYQEAVRGLVLVLMAKLQRLPNLGSVHKTQTDKWQFRQIHPALLYMRHHYADKIHMIDLAAMCNMSVSNFREVFHKNVGKSPSQFLMQNRLAMAAAQMRATQDKILKIAFDNGFPSLSSFNRAFSRAKGMSPSAWRRQEIA